MKARNAARDKLEGMRIHLTVAILVFAAGCNHATFDKDIVGAWESAGTPSSSALPESLRNSPSWSAQILFKDDGTFEWELDAEEDLKDRYRGTFEVVGYSLEILVTHSDGAALSDKDQLRYTVRQQSTGSIRLPLPQDWTGPSVDYFKKN